MTRLVPLAHPAARQDRTRCWVPGSGGWGRTQNPVPSPQSLGSRHPSGGKGRLTSYGEFSLRHSCLRYRGVLSPGDSAKSRVSLPVTTGSRPDLGGRAGNVHFLCAASWRNGSRPCVRHVCFHGTPPSTEARQGHAALLLARVSGKIPKGC
jgi:hypothetical protein